MSNAPVVSVTDELIAELEAELAAYEIPTGPVRGVNLHSVRALLAEREELKRDAARYRWLKERQTFQWLIQDWHGDNDSYTDVDSVIDELRSK